MASEPLAHCINLKWRSEDVKLQEKADFTSLLLSGKVLTGLEKSGFKTPSPIQLEAIPIGRFGKDLVVQAKSGTGKTLVFTIVALEMLLDVKHPQVLVLAPTREIAFQVCSVIQAVGSEFNDLKCCTFIGGTLINEDKDHAHDCQIAVGSPGRIKQLINDGILKTNSIRLFVLDEADVLLNNTFLTIVDDIFCTLPKDKQVIATSATYPKKLMKLVNRYFRKPYIARLNVDKLALLGMIHYTYSVNSSEMAVLDYKQKLICLERVLSTIKFSQCLVFCNTISRVKYLSTDIRKWGFATASISSAKEQGARLKAIDNLKRFKCKVLVSSDLTSRGIDAENVDLVINFDAPTSTEVYLHRAGRAGRYGSKGVTITFLNEKESKDFECVESGGNFKSYYLPEPIPANLVNIRPESFVERAQIEQISTDSSEEPIAENNVHKESDQDINEKSDKRSSENGELFPISVNDKGVLESSIAEEIESASSLDQNVDSTLCHSSNIETKPPEVIQSENNKGEIPLTDTFEPSDSSTESATSQSCMDEYAESQNKIENPSFEIPETVREDKAKEDSVVSDCKAITKKRKKKSIKKLEPKVKLVDMCKTIENIDENSIKNLGFEANSESQSLYETEEDLSQTVLGIQSTSDAVKENLREMCSTISNLVHEKNKDTALAKAENLKCGVHSPDVQSDSIEPSNGQKPVCSKDIAQLGAGLSEYYLTVLNSFAAECLHNPKVSATEEDETEISKAPIEKESTSHKNSLPENQLQNNYKNESGTEEETESSSEIESFLESTVKGEVIFTAKATDDSSDSSSSFSWETSDSFLVLKQKFKEMVKESYKKQPPRNGFMPTLSASNLKNIARPTAEKSQSKGAVFISSSATSSVVSETSGKAYESSETSYEASAESSYHIDSSKIESSRESMIKGEIIFTAKATDDFSDSNSSHGSEASYLQLQKDEEMIQDLLKKQPPRNGFMPTLSASNFKNMARPTAKKSQSEEAVFINSSETSSESSSDIDSNEIQKPKHRRGPKASSVYSRSTIASKDNCKSKQLSRRNKQQPSRKSTYNFPENSTQNNRVYNSSLHDISDISRHQKTCNLGHGNSPCTNSMGRNSHFSGLQYINQLPYNCSQPTHQCHFPHANSGYQSHLYKQWYDTFYEQWQCIHYSCFQ